MARVQSLAVLLVFSLVMNSFCLPAVPYRSRREYKNTVDSKEVTSVDDDNNQKKEGKTSIEDSSDFDDDDDDFDFDFDFDSPPPNATGGSSFVSLLNIANALFPAFSASNPNNKLLLKITNMIQNYVRQRKTNMPNWKRFDITDNKIDVAPKRTKTTIFLRQESSENSISSTSESESDTLESLSETSESEDSESVESHKNGKASDSNNVSENEKGSDSHASESHEKTSDSNSASESRSDDSSEENGAEESVEKENDKNGDDSNSKQDSGSDSSNSSDDSDYDEPDDEGQGGGLLGVLAKLSGGDGDSDLATLLSTLGGIIGNLSGDGVDLNDVISSSLGLLVGLLSGGEEHPGDTVASYLITTLGTITEGGAKNNGLFFGKFISKLLKGISAAETEDENDESPPQVDSAGFFISLIMGLLGDMSKTSSSGSFHSSSKGDKAELIFK